MYKTILVPLDQSQQAESALSVAASFARLLNASIDLIVASSVGLDTEEHEQYLQKVAGNLDVPIGKLEVCAGTDAATTIVNALAARPDALLCMSTHGRSGLSQALLGSVAEDVIIKAGMPVLIVGPEVSDHVMASLDAMQVCLDGSESAAQLIPFASDWAKKLSARLWLVEVQPVDNKAVE
ncbi:MAG: universal stress protein, partial [Acidimicrobiales bacterium]